MSFSHSIRRVPIFSLLGANAISTVGNMMSAVAIPWFVLQTTGSPAKTGLTGAAIALGVVLAGFFGGPIVDRLGFKTISVIADLMSGLTTALVPLLFFTVGLEFWQLILLVFLGAVLDAPGGAARDALIPELSSLANMPIERANSADASIPRFAQLLGPVLSGVLITLIGASNVLWINAASFMISAVLILVCVPSPSAYRDAASRESVSSGRYFVDLLEGVRFIGGNGLLLSMILIATVTNLLDAPLISVILPVYSETEFGSAASFGLIFGSFGAGALLGTVLYGAVGYRMPRRLTFIFCFVTVPAHYLVLALTPPLTMILIVVFLTGVAAGPINPIYSTVIQEHTPPAVRGRVFGVLAALAMGGMPLGLAIGGFLIEGLGLSVTLFALWICYLIVTVSMFFNPALNEMDEPAAKLDVT